MRATIVATTDVASALTAPTLEPSAEKSATILSATRVSLSFAAASLTAPTTSTNLRMLHFCEHERHHRRCHRQRGLL